MANRGDVVVGAAVVGGTETTEAAAVVVGIAGKTSARSVVEVWITRSGVVVEGVDAGAAVVVVVVVVVVGVVVVVVLVVVVVVVTTLTLASADFVTSGPTTGWPMTVATLVKDSVKATVVQVYVTTAPGASVPIERAQLGVLGSVTATFDNAVSPLFVTVIEKVTEPPANTDGVTVLFAMLIEGLITATASVSEAVTFGPTEALAVTDAVFVNEAVATTLQLMVTEPPTPKDGIT